LEHPANLEKLRNGSRQSQADFSGAPSNKLEPRLPTLDEKLAPRRKPLFSERANGKPNNEKRPMKVGQASDEPLPGRPSATIVNNAPGGFAVSGGTLNNPTVNNFAPARRQLSEDQSRGLHNSFCALPRFNFQKFQTVYPAFDDEAGAYQKQLLQLFYGCHRIPASETATVYPPGEAPEGVTVRYADDGDPATILFVNSLNAALVSNGISSMTSADELLKTGEVRLVIGSQKP
jgi:hypothetical protein